MKDKYVRQEVSQDVTHTEAAEGLLVTAIDLPDLELGDAIVVRQVFISLSGANGIQSHKSAS